MWHGYVEVPGSASSPAELQGAQGVVFWCAFSVFFFAFIVLKAMINDSLLVIILGGKSSEFTQLARRWSIKDAVSSHPARSERRIWMLPKDA